MIKISINNQLVEVEESLYLLDACRQAGFEVPSLCGGPNGQGQEACGLCAVEVDGEVTLSCRHPVKAGIEVQTQSETLTQTRQAALKRILSNHTADCEAPCKTACPADVDIQGYLYDIAQGDHTKAVQTIKDTLPMPLSIGRVCPAFCESACRRTLVDEPLAIRQLKRHAADLDLNDQAHLADIAPAKGKKVAIIGGGPAGLSAGYFLTHNGYQATVFEAMPQAGGWLRYGIPEYRLPKATLDKEIELMCRAGMNIELNQSLGRDFTLEQLSQEYDAVCLAIGAQKAVAMDYTGSDLQGCMLGVDYLKDFTLGKDVSVGNKVAVIGGGNTAIDCARTALRQGAEVTIIYRRTKADMPAEDYEIHEAEVEGVNFQFLSLPVENLADDQGRVCKVKVETLKLGEPDASGRRRPESTGEFQWMEFDTVIAAVSQKPDAELLASDAAKLGGEALPLTRWTTADADPSTMHAGIGNLFAIGDFRLGPATAVEAIGDGKKAAIAIDRFLQSGLVQAPKAQFNSQKAKSLKEVEARFLDHWPKQARLAMPELTSAQRQGSFDEVELGFDAEAAIAEAARCLECGCQVNTQCGLRDYATEYRISDADLDYSKAQQKRIDSSAPFINLDPNRCISCGQCVVACNERGVHGVLGFKDDQPSQRVCFDGGELMANSNCSQCGACIQACPVGALTDARDRSQGRQQTLKTVDTICTYCGVGCGIRLHVDEDSNRIIKVTGVEESPVNEGMLCVKGRFGFDFIQSKERLTQPLIRKDGELVPTTWANAIGYVAARIEEVTDAKGGNAMAGFASAKATNEDNFLFQKLFRSVIGTNNIDHCARLCHSTTVSGLRAAVGSGAMTNDIPSIKESDLIFVIGSDTTAAHPVIASHIKQAVRHHGARLIVADPKRIGLSEHAQLYACHRPGTDVMLLNGIAREILVNGWQDDDYVARRTEGFEAFKAEVMKPDYTPEQVELVSGVPASQVREIARLMGTAIKTAVYYAMGITQHTTGHDNVRAIANLQLLCGNIGVEGAGINPLRGQSNVQGACDMGALPNYLPGYQNIEEPAIRERFEALWHTDLSPVNGLAVTEVMDAILEDQVDGLYVMGENPVLSDPDQKHVIKALQALDLLVVQDIFLTETAQMADVVLPAFAFAEKQGHFTNTERRVQRLNAAVNAPGQARNDWEIIQLLAQALGANWRYRNEKAICNEINLAVPQYAGIRWERVGTNGIQWPCVDDQCDGMPVMHVDKFAIGERAYMEPIPFKYAAELPCEEYPLVLTTGRLLEQFHTGTMTRKTKGLNDLAGPTAMLSVADAERLGIGNGDPIRLTTRRGDIELNAFVTKRIQKGVVFTAFHFEEAPANRLTNPALDPHAKIPEFKVCAVKVEKRVTSEVIA
ncbi:formate dehydrogenase subunit alpha [Ferrimonas sp. SCSIO 43195]|uniref:formate dehydrogenase subunit alpha n=1 Tax=Ferrimonas sp. SCSIO 43195 TaxID=2822844 RepID=UPI0020750F66|nr:formate dehydrogenase subunit alpha [Ferrimonas sp. SCSIO 43195]USD39089.1 formate dehydrogenase subunit alpha [Ferrimonas sp. SCSIO 43195]